MKKVFDCTPEGFGLLKEHHAVWGSAWEKGVFSKHPTLWAKYLQQYQREHGFAVDFWYHISRKELDRMYIRWQQVDKSVFRDAFRWAGQLYARGFVDFGVFFFVGLQWSAVTPVRTRKGIAFLCDVWFFGGEKNGKGLESFCSLDAAAALFSRNDPGIQP
ncbi:MAG TPA: hypothetical protein P5560_08910 [Thermotogota bacterium]|nr:hypothetical protein [Thermotogota bacterium]